MMRADWIIIRWKRCVNARCVRSRKAKARKSYDFRAFAFLDLTHRAFTQRFQRMMIQSARIIFLHTESESLNTGTVNKSRYTYELINKLRGSHDAIFRSLRTGDTCSRDLL